MSYEWFIAQRYFRSKRRHPFVGVTSGIAVAGIAVGVAALITVLAVMNGFDEELKNRIIGMRAHLVIEKDGNFTEAALLSEKLGKIKGIRGAASYVEGQALLQAGEWGAGVLVRGVDVEKEKSVSRFFDSLVEGTLSGAPNSAVIGSELAKRARLKIRSEFLLLSQNQEKPIRYTVEGIFSSGMYEYDANLVFLNLQNARMLFQMKDGASGVSVALENPERADQVKREIQKHLSYPYDVRTWMEANKTLFGALKLEKTVMFLILALIIFVACLNIAGSLTILVMDKTKDIGVLKALGATQISLVKIFALDGIWIGSLGAVFGFLLGWALCALLKNTSWVELPKEIYYMDRLPVRMGAWDTARVIAVAVFLSWASALYPAWTAGRLDPVKALRYE